MSMSKFAKGGLVTGVTPQDGAPITLDDNELYIKADGTVWAMREGYVVQVGKVDVPSLQRQLDFLSRLTPTD